jgi:hypothetical protein
MSTSGSFSNRFGRRALRGTALVASCLAAGAVAAEPVGQIVGIEGQVSVKQSAGPSYVPAALDGRLELGDWIRTERASRAKLLLRGDTLISVDEETEFGLDESVLGGAGGAPTRVIEQVSGQIMTTVGETFGGAARLEVHTPTAVLGIKGTVFEVRVRDATLVCVHDGRVSARNRNETVKGELEVSPGWCREVREGQPPSGLISPPRDFRSTGPGPGTGGSLPGIEALLFGRDANLAQVSSGPGENGPAFGGEELGGGRGSGHRGDLFDWIAEVPPVGAAPDQEGDVHELVDPEAAYEDDVDSDLASSAGISDDAISIGGGEAPGPDLD